MDDPWANAWGEPTTVHKQPLAPIFPTHDADDEEDITIPSWDGPPASTWSDNTSLWGSRSPALDKFPSWTSPYDNLPLGKSSISSAVTAQDSDIPFNDEQEEDDPQLQRDSESTPEPESEFRPEPPIDPPFEPPLSSPTFPATSPSVSPPGSPDAFGTFETGLNHRPTISDTWTPENTGFEPHVADAAWGGAWVPSDVEEPENNVPETVDEWEVAKQQKAMQDKHVPPELLGSILSQFTELANELYPPPPPPNVDPNDYRVNRHKGLEGLESMNATIVRLLPTDFTLPLPRPFPKSEIAKSAAEALRLSRSAAFVRFGPLSHYSATKGSTAWEASIKSRPEVVGEPDLLPPGWRIVDTKQKEEATSGDKKKHGGSLMRSFFARRAATPPFVGGGDGTPQHPTSPPPTSSPRASMDSTKSSLKSPTNTSATSAAASPAVSGSTSSQAPPVAPVISRAESTNAGGKADPNITPVTPPAAPSAVSRFLGRFGRKAATPAGPQNLSLSEGDFDFLADIEGAPPESNSAPASNFSMLDDPVPLPAKLAPPPRASTPVITSQNHGDESRRGIDTESDDLAILAAPLPPLSLKPFAPPPVKSASAPASAPKSMPQVDMDFSAWGFDNEVKSDEVEKWDPATRVIATTQPQTRQQLSTKAVTNARGSVLLPRRTPTAIMSSGPSKPPLVPKLEAAFSLAPPLSQTQSASPALLPPPPRNKAPTSVLLDDDDFSDFHGPAPIPSSDSSNAVYDASFSSSISSERALFSSTSSPSVPTNLFDDFDDFMQASPQEAATLRTPSPPRPPAKHPHVPAPPLSSADPDDTPLAFIAQGTKAQSSLLAKRAANNQRAVSLVKTAAASSGVRWPAPPSPLPDALAPPRDQSDPFGFGAQTMQSQQATFIKEPALSLPAAARTTVLSPSPEAQVPPFFPPPPDPVPLRTLSSPPPPRSLPQNGTVPVLQRLTPAPPPPLSKSSGGLSAQDLSFFEGL